jgi:GxxExxY protein
VRYVVAVLRSLCERSKEVAMNRREKLNELTSKVIGAAITVHRELGPGLLESVYQRCMVIELRHMGLKVETEVPVKIRFRGQEIGDESFRMDLLVENEIVVELKSVEEIKPVYKKQLLTYLKLSGKEMGLLINFNEVLLKDGVTRITTLPLDEDE